MMHTEVLYVSTASSPAQFEYLKDSRRAGVQEVTYGMPESAYKFHNLLQQGLAAAGASVTSLVGRPTSPRIHKGVVWRRVKDRVEPGITVDHLGFPNLRGVKQVWLGVGLAIRALGWRLRTRDSRRVLIMDAAYVSALPGVLFACAGPGVTTTAIFADIYTYMADVTDASRAQSVRHRAIARIVRTLYAQLDGFILLTEAMNAVVNRRGAPHLVMEGMADARAEEAVPAPSSKPANPTVLYAGALRKVYGLDALLAGFAAWPRPDARLVIYGAGDYAEEVSAAAEKDPRVDFRGSASIAEVFQAEQAATLLVNPRPIDQEFTKYSFPSKTMEYMSSGTPVLTTALPGMPPEYYPHVLLIEEAGAAGVTEALERAFGESAVSLAERGRRARDFVLTEKSNQAQARRILEFAGGLR